MYRGKKKTQNKTKAQNAKKRTRKQRQQGGAFEIGQKYIQDEQRDRWTSTFYPLSSAILSAIKTIPWSTYEFNGVSENIAYDAAKDTAVIQPVQMTAAASPIPFRVVGGAACELYQVKWPNGPSLHKFVEPTADIDLHASYPILTNSPDTDLCIIYNHDHYTALGDHYTRWLMTQLAIAMQPVAALTDRLSAHMTPNMNDETNQADLVTHVGNLLITRSAQPADDMIKIQVSTCIGDIVCSHLVEFIFTIDMENPISVNNTSWFNTVNLMRINGVVVESLLNMVYAQFNGLKGRMDMEASQVYNHYARIRYMVALMVYLHKKGDRSQLWEVGQGVPWQLVDLLKGSYILSNPRACPPPAVCDEGEVIGSLLTMLRADGIDI